MESSQTPTVDGDKTSNPVVGGISNLPDAYQHQFFSKPENWTGKRLSKWIETNPVVDLCLRIATYSVAPHGKGCYDPRRAGIRLSRSNRLYQMIGKHVSRGTFRRMLTSDERQWKFVEECWVANMHTVLLNQDFDPVKRDRLLFRAIRNYKIWFLNFAFAGRHKTITKRDGTKKRILVPTNFDRLLLGLKKIAGWLQWACLSDMKDHNDPAPPVPYWIGYHSQTGSHELVWFGGHLSRYRSILIDLQFTDRELANLCQIRTFGRALPCPTRNLCNEAFAEQLNILSVEKKTPPEVLRIVRQFANELGKKLNVREMPLHTHVSVSTSGCFERSQTEGGLASVGSEWINILDIPLNEVLVGPYQVLPGSFSELHSLPDYMSRFPSIIDIRDVYGELLFPRPKSFYALGVGLKSLGLKKKNTTLLHYLYGGAGLSTMRRKASKFLGEEALPSTTGKSMLLVASSLAYRQGEFISDMGYNVNMEFLHVGSLRIPFVTGPVMRRHMIYRPISMPKVKLDCLAEPGAKTRPLGKNQAWFTIVTRAMRFMAEPIIARDGRARIGLRSTNKMWSFLKFLKEKGPSYDDPIAQSSDLKSATDLIPLDVLEAIWSGFLRSLPKSHPFWVFYGLITCKRSMFKASKFKFLEFKYPDGTLNQRGSFMGEPMSFLTLTLVNLLVEDISDYYYCNPKVPLWSQPSYFGSQQDPCCICGDDVAALRNNIRRITVFKTVMLALSMLFSWKDGMSRRIIIFCEDHALLTGRGTQFKIEYIDVIKSRLLTTMSRDHSENRSSILGKGRMLSNQLDYFSNENLKIAVLSYFRNIFDRCYNYGVIRNQACKLPLYLPPCAGGMGLPIVDSLMPSFMWPYIGYIYKVLSDPSEYSRLTKLTILSSMNSRIKHGISSDVSLILEELLKPYSRALPGESRIKGNTIYNDDFIITLLTNVYSVDIPLDPYLKKYDFSSLENEAARIGFVPLSSFPSEIERVLNFQKFIKDGFTKETRTYNKWVKQSSRYWKKVFKTEDKAKLEKLGREKFTSISSLEKAITRGFSGWIYVGSDIDNMNLINSGPSLKINFNKSSRLGGKMSLYNDKFVPDI
uniref:Putative RdRp n=1 Tax=Monilinia narnavirus H TaxID=2592751 RepID=A0A7G3KH47_9VIRU|nr:putative RdRp [Monilinia narnavirus H]